MTVWRRFARNLFANEQNINIGRTSMEETQDN